MNKNSNTYIISYAAIMVIVVAAVLSFAALSLKTKQENNVKMEKMGDVLLSIGQGQGAATAADKFSYIDTEYKKYITKEFAVDSAGNVVMEGQDAFNLVLNLKAEYDKPLSERALPIFESNVDGTTRYVIPVWGSGLWGPVWGYIALGDDFDTIYGAIFGHKSETPGLGAEIATPPFQKMFDGKTIFQDGKLVSIAVLKGGGSTGNPHAVDAISGGTITSRAVEVMLKDCLSGYTQYFEKMRAAKLAPAEPAVVADSTAAADSTNVITNAGHE